MSKRIGLALLSVWPGLPQICMRHEVAGLAIATCFAVLINTALVATFVWTEALAVEWLWAIWVSAAGLWLASALVTGWWLWRRHPERFRQVNDQLYREALHEYLGGRWSEARWRLDRILSADQGDCDALIQLGTLCRHTGQTEDARRMLRRCRELDTAGKWRWEIDRELAYLSEP